MKTFQKTKTGFIWLLCLVVMASTGCSKSEPAAKAEASAQKPKTHAATKTQTEDVKQENPMNVKKAAAKTLAAAAATAVIATNAMAAGTVTGTIKYEGAVPNMRTINMAADPTCVKNNAGKEVKAETLVLGANKELANVYVKISSGLEGKDFEAPATPKTLDQNGCMYTPHIVGVMAGQPLKILNSDATRAS